MGNGVHLKPEGLDKNLKLKGLLNKNDLDKDEEILKFNSSNITLQAGVFLLGESVI